MIINVIVFVLGLLMWMSTFVAFCCVEINRMRRPKRPPTKEEWKTDINFYEEVTEDGKQEECGGLPGSDSIQGNEGSGNAGAPGERASDRTTDGTH